MPVITKRVRPGGWRTLESSWNVPFKAWFRHPAGAKVKIRYGIGFFGRDGAKATLDGVDLKELGAGRVGSLLRARLQIKVKEETTLTYQIEMGSPGTISVPVDI